MRFNQNCRFIALNLLNAKRVVCLCSHVWSPEFHVKHLFQPSFSLPCPFSSPISPSHSYSIFYKHPLSTKHSAPSFIFPTFFHPTFCQERPKSALEHLSPPPENQPAASGQPRGRMSAEEQLERMKRHQRALVRERKRNVSQSDRSCAGLSTSTATSQRSSSSSRLPASTSDPPASVRYPPPQRSSRHREHHHHRCYAALQPPAT